MNYFVYNGVSSLDMGLRIESKDVFSAPEYDVEFLSIPGRDGDLIAGSGRYPNVQITYPALWNLCQAGPKSPVPAPAYPFPQHSYEYRDRQRWKSHRRTAES